MGYLFDRYGIQLLDFPDAEGACRMCGAEHDADMPHDNESLLWQYRFYDEHGHWPSWLDAMAHCEEHVRRAWIDALGEEGVDVEEEPNTINAQIIVTLEGETP